jgi:iron(II)-dependent oxidoreductase
LTSTASAVRSSYAALRIRLEDSRQLTNRLFDVIRPQALFDRPIPERHRLIFYLGHLEAFDWNLIARGTDALPSFHPEFDRLFAFGIDPIDGGLPTDQPSGWPGVEEIRQYNARTREKLDRLFENTDGTLLNVAIEHRLMHAETLAYLLHQLDLGKKVANGEPIRTAVLAKKPRMAAIVSGTATLGQCRSSGAFGWDNEFESVSIQVPEFRADIFPVTNAQFLEFVLAGGYSDQPLWSPEDWTWKEARGMTHPCFWRRKWNEWTLRTMFAEIPLPQSWPVYVSHAEASAYARWVGKQLPTEAQWHRMAYGTSQGNERSYPWGEAVPASEFGNFDFARWDATPVQAHPQGNSAFGVSDLLGNGWEWTSTTFAPLPDFREFSFYPGYSANFFDGKHYVLKGGSARTAACMLRRSFRNWFQPHYPYLYAKFRCVEA